MKELKNEQEFSNDYFERIKQQEKPRCCICKFYDGDRRNECGQARCTKHPFWVKDDEVCDSYKSGVHFDWRMPPTASNPKVEPKEKNTNWGWKILAALISLPIVILVLLTIVSAFVDVWELSEDSIGLFIINLVAIPLAVVGGFKVVKGLFVVANEAIEKHNITKDWQLSTYVAITMLEVIALVYIFLRL